MRLNAQLKAMFLVLAPLSGLISILGCIAFVAAGYYVNIRKLTYWC